VAEDYQAAIPQWFGENSCEVTWQSHNSHGQPSATNKPQPAGEHEGNEGHGDNDHTNVPYNTMPAEEHDSNERSKTH